VKTVKDAAEKAGRDPATVKVWSCFATVGDHLPEELRLKKTVARLATYLQGYGDLLVSTNGWDPAVLQRFREDAVVTSIPGGIDHEATAEQIEHIATLIPDGGSNRRRPDRRRSAWTASARNSTTAPTR
jgi:hypothetical protein